MSTHFSVDTDAYTIIQLNIDPICLKVVSDPTDWGINPTGLLPHQSPLRVLGYLYFWTTHPATSSDPNSLLGFNLLTRVALSGKHLLLRGEQMNGQVEENTHWDVEGKGGHPCSFGTPCPCSTVRSQQPRSSAYLLVQEFFELGLKPPPPGTLIPLPGGWRLVGGASWELAVLLMQSSLV